MTKEMLDVLAKLEEKAIFWPLDRESDSVEVDGMKFTHQELVSDIY